MTTCIIPEEQLGILFMTVFVISIILSWIWGYLIGKEASE
jgi:hypothetical protein